MKVTWFPSRTSPRGGGACAGTSRSPLTTPRLRSEPRHTPTITSSPRRLSIPISVLRRRRCRRASRRRHRNGLGPRLPAESLGHCARESPTLAAPASERILPGAALHACPERSSNRLASDAVAGLHVLAGFVCKSRVRHIGHARGIG